MSEQTESCSTMTTQLVAKGISTMPKAINQLKKKYYNQYAHLYSQMLRIEEQIGQIQRECPEKTSCYLRYAWWANDYACGEPHKGSVRVEGEQLVFVDGFERWMLILADFYASEATRLLRERDKLLRTMYLLASRYYKLTGNRVTWLLPKHRRKHSFE